VKDRQIPVSTVEIHRQSMSGFSQLDTVLQWELWLIVVCAVIVIVIVVVIVSMEGQTAASAVDSTAGPWNVPHHPSESSFSPPPD